MKHLKTFESFSNIDYTNEEFNILKGITNLMKGATTVNLKDKPSDASAEWLKKSPWNKEVERYSEELELTSEQVKNFFRLLFDKVNKGIKVEDVQKNKFTHPKEISKLDISVEGDEITVKDKKISTSNPGTASR